MKLILKCTTLFREIEQLYNTQYYRSGDYCAKVRALHELLQRRAIDRLARRLEHSIAKGVL